MRSWTLLLGACFLLASVTAAQAQDGSGAAAPAPVTWDDFDDPGFDPEVAEPGAAPAAPTEGSSDDAVAPAASEGPVDPAAPAVPETPVEPDVAESAADVRSSSVTSQGRTVVLGPKGVDAEGRIGRVHTVVSGDTLWDISEAYLGTPWVWPSVWNDNAEIANPHLINPGDHIWITANEMRPVSAEEASRLISDASQPEPAAHDAGFEVEEELAAEEPVDAEPESYPADSLDGLPVMVPKGGRESGLTGRQVTVADRGSMSFMKDELLQAATMVVGKPSERNYLSMPDLLYLGLGQGEVEVGDEYTFFRNTTEVYDPRNGNLLGHYVDVLGYAEVLEVRDETSIARIVASYQATTVGDRAVPRVELPTVIDVRTPEPGLDGLVSFLPANRTLAGTIDYVVLDLGRAHGLEIGTDLEVYEPSQEVFDEVNRRTVRTPEHVTADLVVVTLEEESSVAFVVHARHEIELGDLVRGATIPYPATY